MPNPHITTGTGEAIIGDVVMTSRRREILTRLWGHRSATFALAIVLVLVILAIFAPIFSRFDPNEIHRTNLFEGSSAAYWFGTDELGRDLFSRTLHGGRISLLVAFASAGLAMVVGGAWGFIAGYRGGWLEEVLMRLVDGIMAIPALLLALVFVASLGTSILNLIIIIGLLASPMVARVARSAVLQEINADYRLAAVAAGLSDRRILLTEVLPNTVPVLLVQASLVAGIAILTEAGLSFLGLGVQPPSASWGTLVQKGYQNLLSTETYVLFPGLFIFVSVWALNILGDGLRDVLDPRVQR